MFLSSQSFLFIHVTKYEINNNKNIILYLPRGDKSSDPLGNRAQFDRKKTFFLLSNRLKNKIKGRSSCDQYVRSF